MFRELQLTLAGKEVAMVATTQGRTVSKVLKYASAEAAKVALANLVKGAEAQKAKVAVTIH